jgi:hypothetical protein
VSDFPWFPSRRDRTGDIGVWSNWLLLWLGKTVGTVCDFVVTWPLDESGGRDRELELTGASKYEVPCSTASLSGEATKLNGRESRMP